MNFERESCAGGQSAGISHIFLSVVHLGRGRMYDHGVGGVHIYIYMYIYTFSNISCHTFGLKCIFNLYYINI